MAITTSVSINGILDAANDGTGSGVDLLNYKSMRHLVNGHNEYPYRYLE